MSQSSRHSRSFRPIRAAASFFRVNDDTSNRIDPDGLRQVATVTVWLHWFAAALLFFQLVYRPGYGLEVGIQYSLAFSLAFSLLLAFNGYTHYRLATHKTMTWRWILALVSAFVALISVSVVIGGGFSHYFLHLLYYPALAGYAVVFTSFRLTMAWVTVVSVLYLAISLIVGDGIDIAAMDEKSLLARIFVMYMVAASVNLVSSFERNRWRAAVKREGALQRERIELSRSLHDTAAQSAYMIGLGIDAIRQIAGDSNEELNARIEATSRMSKTAIWQLRHPIDMGLIFDGRKLGVTLESHVATFTSITSVPAELAQNGVEPPLHADTRSMLFSIAHNALTNAFRHAEASKVMVRLDFGQDEFRLSVSDDGVGLPDDYEERGHGFANMRAYAERLGGRLIVEPGRPVRGANVTCVMPLGRGEQEG